MYIDVYIYIYRYIYIYILADRRPTYQLRAGRRELLFICLWFVLGVMQFTVARWFHCIYVLVKLPSKVVFDSYQKVLFFVLQKVVVFI